MLKSGFREVAIRQLVIVEPALPAHCNSLCVADVAQFATHTDAPGVRELLSSQKINKPTSRDSGHVIGDDAIQAK
jgi:hypothetical protein